MAAVNSQRVNSSSNSRSFGKTLKIRRRKGIAALSAAASAVGLFGFTHRAMAADSPTDTYSFIYNYQNNPNGNPSGTPGVYNGDLTNVTNWYDVTSMYDGTLAGAMVPTSTSTVQFDTTYANMDSNPASGGPGQGGGNIGVTLSAVSATTWAAVNFLSPGLNNSWTNSGGTVVPFILTVSGSTNAALTIGGLSNVSSGGNPVTDVAISVPVALSQSQNWNIASATYGSGTPTVTTALSLTGGLALGGNQLTVSGAGNVGISGGAGISNGGIVMSGTGVLTLGGPNTYVGGLTLNSGTVAGSNPTAFGGAGNLITFAGGILNPTGSAINNLNIYSVNGSGAGSTSATDWNNVPLNLFISNAANTFTIAQSLTGATSLNQTGSGAIFLPNAANSYSGGTSVASGSTLVVQDLASLGSGYIYNSGTIDVLGNQTITGNQMGTAALRSGAPFGLTLANPAGTLTLNNSGGSVTNNQLGVQNNGTLIFDELHSSATSPIANGGAAFSSVSNVANVSWGGVVTSYNVITNTGGPTLVGAGGTIEFLANSNPATPTVQIFATSSFSGFNTIIATGTSVQGNTVGQETIYLGDYTFDNTNNVSTLSVAQTSSAAVEFVGPVTASGGTAFLGGTVASSDFAVVGNVYSAPGLLSSQFLESALPAEGYEKGGSGWATYGLSDWAAVTTPNASGTSYIVPGSAISGFYVHLASAGTGTTTQDGFVGYNAPRVCANISNENVDVDCNGFAVGSGNATWTSLRFNSPTGGLSGIGGNLALQFMNSTGTGLLESGNILVTPNIGTQNVIISYGAATVGGTSSASDLDFDPGGRANTGNVPSDVMWDNDYQNNTAGMLIIAEGIENSDFVGGMTVAGPGMQVYATTDNYTGATTIDTGTLEVQNNASLGGAATTQNSLNFFGGTFVTMQTTTLDGTIFGPTGAGTARAINVNVGGGDLAAIHTVVSGQTLAQILTVDGAISGIGNLNIGMGPVVAVVNNAVTSTLAFNKTSGNGKVVLSGNATNFIGNIALAFGTLQADGTYNSATNFSAAAGTTFSGASPSTLTSVTAATGSTVYPGDSGTGVMTVAQYTAANNSTLAFGFSPATTSSTDPLTITTPTGLGVNPSTSSTVWLSLLQTGTTQEYYGKGTYDLVNAFGSNSAFSINGTLASIGVGTQEIPNDVDGFNIFNPFPKSVYALQTLNSTQNPALSANETELQLTIVNTIITSIWGNASGGNTPIMTNWTNNQVPNGASDTAVFPSLTGTTIGVSVTSPLTLGGINFNTTNTYTISGAGPIAFANNGLDGAISITNGAGHNQTISAPMDISGAPALDLTVTNPGDTLVLSGAIVDDGAGSGLSLNASNNGGAGTAILIANENFSGAITVGNQLGTGLGTLQLGNGSVAGLLTNNTNAINLNAGSLAFDEPSNTTVTLANTIVVPAAGGGTLVQEGTGSLLILAASGAPYNSPYPLLQVNAGTLRFGSVQSDNVGDFNQLGGLVDLGGQAQVAFDSLTGSAAATIDNLSASPTVLIVDNTVNGTYSGTIQNSQAGTISMLKEGGSTQVLTGNDTFSGGFNLVGGAIQFDTQSSIPTQGTFTMQGSGNVGPILASNITFGLPLSNVGGTTEEFISLPVNGTTAELSGPVTVNGGATQFRMGFGNSLAMLYMTGTETDGQGQYCFFTEGNFTMISGYSLTAYTTGANGANQTGITFGRAQDGSGETNLFITMDGNASIVNGSGGAGLGNAAGTAMGLISVTLNNQAVMNLQDPLNDNSSTFEMGGNGAATYQGSLILNGGTFDTSSILMNPGSGTAATSTAIITFNGGVLEANGSSNNFLPPGQAASGYTGTGTAAVVLLNIGTGGAHISTNGYNEMVSTVGGFASIGTANEPGLIKEGGGILAFPLIFSGAANNPYLGYTQVDGGLLEAPGASLETNGNNFLASTAYIQVLAGGGVGQDDGTITAADSSGAGGVLTLLAEGASLTATPQHGFLALAGGTADTLTNINFNSAGAVAGTYNMITGAGGNLSNMAIGALSDYLGQGTLGASVAYTGTITPSTSGTYANTYHLGGGGTLELVNTNALTGGNKLLNEYGGAVWLAGINNYTGTTTINGTSVVDNDLTSTNMVETTTLMVSYLGDADGGTNVNNPTNGSSLGNPSIAGGFTNPADVTINGGDLDYVGLGDTSNLLFTMGQYGAEIDSSGSGALILQNTGSEVYAGGDTGTITFTLGGSYGSAGFVNVFKGAFGTPPAGVTLSLMKTGAGEWNISGDTYNGGVDVAGGVLQLGSSVAVVTSGPLGVASGATLDLNGFNASVGPMSGGGTIDDVAGAASSTLTVNTTGGTSTFTGIIQNTSHSVALALNGTGTQFFTGNSNTYSGGTTIGVGTTVTLNGGNGTLGGTPLGTGAISNSGALNFNRSDTTFALVNNISGAGTFNMGGSGTLSLTGVVNYSGTTTISAGTLEASAPGQLSTLSAIVNNSNLEILGGSQASPIVSGNISGTGNLIVGNATTPAYLKLGTSTGTSSVNWTGLQIGATSALDINNDTLAINYAGQADPVASVVNMLVSGYGPLSNWQGTLGITSSAAGASPLNPLLSVGYADGNNPYDAGKGITGLAANEILIRYTLAGDANLDYQVNFNDLLIVAQDFNKSGQDWVQGNFIYAGNGLVNFADLLIVAQNFNKVLGSNGTAVGSQSESLGGGIINLPSGGGSGVSDDVGVPEPTSFALVGGAAAGLLARRRRRTSK
jgi:fibronectin-binding autotransporter adhesin